MSIPGFDAQERPDALAYHFWVCHTCKMTWYLPKDPARRTNDPVTRYTGIDNIKEFPRAQA